MTTTTTADHVAPSRRRILTVVLTCFALAAALFVGVGAQPAHALTNSELASRIYQTVNALRAKHGLPTLKATSALRTTALTHSQRMAAYQLRTTQTPGESSVSMRIYRAGYNYNYAGELTALTRTQTGLLHTPYDLVSGPTGQLRMYSRYVHYMNAGVYRDSHGNYWLSIDFARSRTLTTASTIRTAIFNQINRQRAANGVPALRMSAALTLSAQRHNQWMAKYNTMSHQLPGEPDLATRILRAAYNYRTAGENVGWNSQMTQSGAEYLQRLMYNEVPPNDGHRVNILNRSYQHVGVHIYFDYTHHKLWLTTDFGSLM